MNRTGCEAQLGYELARAVQLSLETDWPGVEYHLERALQVVAGAVHDPIEVIA